MHFFCADTPTSVGVLNQVLYNTFKGLVFFVVVVFVWYFFLTVALPFKQCLPILYFLLQQHWCFNFMSIFQLWSDSGLEDWWISLLCFHWVWKGTFFRFTVCRFCLWKFIFGILLLRKNTEILKRGVANFSLTGLVIEVVGPRGGKHLSLYSIKQRKYVLLRLSWNQCEESRSLFFPRTH